MYQFSISIPLIKCYVRNEYLFNLESGYGEFTSVVVFGITSLTGRSVGFHIMTNGGAQIARVPISALVSKVDADNLNLDWLQLWDCFSYQTQVVSYDYLKKMKCKVLLKDKNWYTGEYVFTIDWIGGDWAEEASDYKCGHLIKLDNGCYAIQPNNRIYWLGDPSFITEPLTEFPGYKINTHNWKCENNDKWVTENTDNYFYHIDKVEE
jgi:hypothetical protein